MPLPMADKAVEQWSAADVGAWLESIELASLQERFAENEITGSVLLSLDTSDLDYMRVTALGHRKTVLLGVQQLKLQAISEPRRVVNAAPEEEEEAAAAVAGPASARRRGTPAPPGAAPRQFERDPTQAEKDAVFRHTLLQYTLTAVVFFLLNWLVGDGFLRWFNGSANAEASARAAAVRQQQEILSRMAGGGGGGGPGRH